LARERDDAVRLAETARADAVSEAELRALGHDVGRLLSGVLDPQGIGPELTNRVRAVIGFDRLEIIITAPDRGHAGAYVLQNRQLRWRPADGGGLPARTLQRVVKDGTGVVEARRGRERRVGASFIAVPLDIGGRVKGALVLSASRAGSYSKRDLPAAEALAAEMAGPVFSWQTYESARRASEERGVLAEIGRLATSSLDVMRIYDEFARHFRRLLPFDALAVVRAHAHADGRAGLVEFRDGVQVQGFEPGSMFRLEDFAAVDGPPGLPRLFDTETLRERAAVSKGALEVWNAGMRSLVAAPLRAGEDLVGYLAIASKGEDRYGETEVALIERVSAQIAGALFNSRLHAALERDASERKVLAEIGVAASSDLNLDTIYERVADELASLLPYDRMVVTSYQPEADQLLVDFVRGAEIEGRELGMMVDTTLVWPVQSAEPDAPMSEEERNLRRVLLSGTGSDGIRDPEGETAGLKSWAQVAIGGQVQPIGYLSIRSREEDAYTEADLDLLGRVASQIASLIQNARLLGEVRRLAGIAETSPDLIAIVHADGRVLYVNPAGLRMIGRPADTNVTGLNVRDHLSRRDTDRLLKEGIAKAAETGFWSAEMSLTRTGRTSVPVEALVVANRDKNGNPSTANVFMRDVTDRLELDHMKSDFVSSVSHELRTPLTSLKVYADILAAGDAGPLSDDQLKYIKTVQASTDRLTTIVDDLLEVSRIESPQFKLDTNEFDLRESVESAGDSMAGLFREREMELALDMPDEPVCVVGDRNRTGQVVLNLLSNAQKYGETGTPASVRVSQQGNEARVDVTDRGPGISREDRENLFSKFFRTSLSRRSRIPGTGLGLSIAKTLVEAQKGRIWLRSQQGKGSTFSFTVPLAGESPAQGIGDASAIPAKQD